MFLDTFEEEINTPATLSKSQTSEHKSPTNEGIYGELISIIYLEIIIFCQLCSAASMKFPPTFHSNLCF